MTFPSTIAADPDPTTQIPWPKGRTTRNSRSPLHISNTQENDDTEGSRSTPQDNKRLEETEDIGKRRLSTWNLFTLSVSMAGAQIAWTVELGYGYRVD